MLGLLLLLYPRLQSIARCGQAVLNRRHIVHSPDYLAPTLARVSKAIIALQYSSPCISHQRAFRQYAISKSNLGSSLTSTASHKFSFTFVLSLFLQPHDMRTRSSVIRLW